MRIGFFIAGLFLMPTLAIAQERHSMMPMEATEYTPAQFMYAVGPDVGVTLMNQPATHSDTVWFSEPPPGAALDQAAPALVSEAQPAAASDAPASPGALLNQRPVAEAQTHDAQRTVYFGFDSDIPINPEVARTTPFENSSTIQLTGRTDAIGSDAYNRELSYRRNASVASIFVDRGARRDQIKMRALGERSPVADNRTEQGRAHNRQVSIEVD